MTSPVRPALPQERYVSNLDQKPERQKFSSPLISICERSITQFISITESEDDSENSLQDKGSPSSTPSTDAKTDAVCKEVLPATNSPTKRLTPPPSASRSSSTSPFSSTRPGPLSTLAEDS